MNESQLCEQVINPMPLRIVFVPAVAARVGNEGHDLPLSLFARLHGRHVNTHSRRMRASARELARLRATGQRSSRSAGVRHRAGPPLGLTTRRCVPGAGCGAAGDTLLVKWCAGLPWCLCRVEARIAFSRGDSVSVSDCHRSRPTVAAHDVSPGGRDVSLVDGATRRDRRMSRRADASCRAARNVARGSRTRRACRADAS